MQRAILLLLAAMAMLATCNPVLAAERRKVIIDQDAFEGPGLQPILMILQDPAIEVLGITIVSGDGWQPEETAATLRMLERIGRTDVPVIAGATFPLVNSKERTRRREALYGPLGYKGAWTDSWPADSAMQRREAHAPEMVPPMAEGAPVTKPAPGSAAEFMLAMTRRYPGQVTILAMGPLTNLALAQRLDDGFAARVREVVTEGGNLIGPDVAASQDEFGTQVAYAPRLSFNHYWDPEAAHIVFTGAWPKLTLVTNDASERAIADRALFGRIAAAATPIARYVGGIAQPGFPLWDEVAAAAWLDPRTITRRGTLAMDVDLMPGANYGALLTWPTGKGPGLGERDVAVIYAVDVSRVKELFVSLLAR